jgi:hypothetical protein
MPIQLQKATMLVFFQRIVAMELNMLEAAAAGDIDTVERILKTTHTPVNFAHPINGWYASAT